MWRVLERRRPHQKHITAQKCHALILGEHNFAHIKNTFQRMRRCQQRSKQSGTVAKDRVAEHSAFWYSYASAIEKGKMNQAHKRYYVRDTDVTAGDRGLSAHGASPTVSIPLLPCTCRHMAEETNSGVERHNEAAGFRKASLLEGFARKTNDSRRTISQNTNLVASRIKASQCFVLAH